LAYPCAIRVSDRRAQEWFQHVRLPLLLCRPLDQFLQVALPIGLTRWRSNPTSWDFRRSSGPPPGALAEDLQRRDLGPLHECGSPNGLLEPTPSRRRFGTRTALGVSPSPRGRGQGGVEPTTGRRNCSGSRHTAFGIARP